MVVTLGGETDTLTKAPAVSTIELDVVDRNGAPTVILAETPLGASGATVDLGDVSQTLVGSLQLIGRDAAHERVVFGAAPYAEIGALTGNVPLFVQRVSALARMPNTIADARRAPLLAISPRALYVAGGTIDGQTTDPALVAYDLLSLASILTTFPAPRHTSSFAVVELAQETDAGDLAIAMWIDDAGASLIGLGTAETYTPPDLSNVGFGWGDVAGGATVMGDDGTAYVIGASRMSAPSTAVFALLASSFTAKTTTTRARTGAAVAWAPGRGVFVYGGSSDAGTAGVEIIHSDFSTSPSGYAPDGTEGLAAVAFSANVMLIAGDGQQPRQIDLTCQTSTCTPQPWGRTPPALTSPSLFALGNQKFLIVGDDASGNTNVIEFDETNLVPITLNIARSGARAIQTQTGAVLIVGGGTNVIESFVP